MTLAIYSDQEQGGNARYYDEDWHLLLETHLPNIQQSPGGTAITISPTDGFRFEGDLYGLLAQKPYYIVPYHRWLVMRLNGMHAPSEYQAAMSVLAIPDFQKIATLFNLYNTVSARLT